MTESNESYDAIIVGAGVAGLYAVYRLREMGLNLRGIDAGSDVGGTWYWNRYPGARVDSQSYVYQYWFSPELIKEWNWRERFPAQPETESYLNFVADKFELRKEFDFNTSVIAADWDEDARRWTIKTDTGKTYEARFFVSCAGMLSAPIKPPFPGMDDFQGTIAHTARYPKEGVELKGKRVGVIGTGATGIQVIQTIASEVAELKVFQRRAQYAIPMDNYEFSDEQREAYKARAEEYAQTVHRTFTGFDFDLTNGSWYDHTPEKRLEILEEMWDHGSLRLWVGSFPEVLNDEKVNEEISEFVRDRIRARIDDPEIAEKLVPTTFGFGTARVPLEDGYYDVFNRDNVELVDVSEAPIEGLTRKGIKTAAAEYELDVVILATGFDAGTGALTRMNITGREGHSLKEEWDKDIRSTLGLQVHGYPNLFTVAGPLASSTAFCNATTCLQQQVDWVADTIAWLQEHERVSIEPTEAKQDDWVNHHDEVANSTLLVKTKSWYMGYNIEGKPKRLLSYIGGVGAYRDLCDSAKSSGYEGFTVG